MRGSKRKIIVIGISLFLILVGILGIVFQDSIFDGMGSNDAENSRSGEAPWPTIAQNNQRTGRSPYDTSHVDGWEKWRFEPADDPVTSPAIGEDGTIYVGSENHLYAVDDEGSEIWKFETNGSVRSSPAIADDGTIYITSSRSLHAVDPDGTKGWRFDLGSSSYSPTVADDGTVYIYSSGGLYAINPDGTERWNFSTPGWISSPPAIGENGTIYIGVTIGYIPPPRYLLLAVNPNGTESWRFSTEGEVRSPPAVGEDGTIYLDTGKLRAIDPDGTERWNFTKGSGHSPAIDVDGTIYVSSKRSLYAVDPDGTERWNTSLERDIVSSPVISDEGTIYVGSRGNDLYAVHSERTEGEPGAERWRFRLASASPAIGSDGTVYSVSERDLFAIGGEEEVDKTVVDGWETDSRRLYFTEGRRTFTHEITFEELGSVTLEIRHENEVIHEHVVQVVEEDPVERVKLSNEIIQQGSELDVVRFDAPEEINVGETVDIEVEIENPVEEHQEISFYSNDELELEVSVPRAGTVDRYRHTFTYEVEDGRVPRDILIEFGGTSDLYRHGVIRVERPDSDELEGERGFIYDGKLELYRLAGDDEVGDFEEDIPTIRTDAVREKIHPPISSYLRSQYGFDNFSDPGEKEINPISVIFGETGEDWLEEPEPLNGEYVFTIDLHGIDLEMEDGRIIFLEEYEEDDEQEIPGFTSSSVLLASSIVVGIYKKKGNR